MSHAPAGARVLAQPGIVYFRADSADSFERFVVRYERHVRLAAYRITHNVDDARDVAQHVFMQAHLARPDFEDRRSIERWLYVVTRNEALSIRRRRCRDEVPPSDLDAPVAPDPEETVLRNERARDVRATIASLPDAYRNIIELRHLRAMASSEIAQALGLPVKRVKRDVERAKARLRIEFRRRGLDDDSDGTR